jgi:mannan endo-1,4-beta-mannosidase
MLFACSSQAKELPTFSGTNNYYLFYKSQKMVDQVFSDAKALGVTVIRTWAFCEGDLHDGYCFQPQPYVYHEPTFVKLDYMIAKARQSGMKLILPLANNWSDFGGVPQYLKWYGLSNHDDFFRDSRIKDTYKAYIKKVLTRVNTITGVPYKDDPTILAWELMNEPRSYDLPTFYSWVDEMAKYIRDIDPNHLRSTGSEGSISSPVYETHKSEAIDFVSFHLYPDWWGFNEEQSKQYIHDHINIARSMGKPVFFGEFGLKDKQRRQRVFQDWYQILREEKVEGAAFWLLAGKQDDGSLYPDYDGFSVYYPESSDVVDIIKGYSEYVKTKGVQ